MLRGPRWCPGLLCWGQGCSSWPGSSRVMSPVSRAVPGSGGPKPGQLTSCLSFPPNALLNPSVGWAPVRRVSVCPWQGRWGLAVRGLLYRAMPAHRGPAIVLAIGRRGSRGLRHCAGCGAGTWEQWPSCCAGCPAGEGGGRRRGHPISLRPASRHLPAGWKPWDAWPHPGAAEPRLDASRGR